MSGLRPALLRGAAVALSAVSLGYTGLWIYFSSPQPPTISESLGLPRDSFLEPPVRLSFQLEYLAALGGVRVLSVDGRGPAERAGLRAGDVILAVNGRSLKESAAPFLATYRSARPGDVVALTVLRSGHAQSITIPALFAARPLADRVFPQLRLVSRTVTLLPVVFLVVALPVLFLRLEDPHAWRVAALLVGAAAAPPAPAFAGVDSRVFALAMAYRGICSALLPLFFYLFFSSFPSRSPVDRRLGWLKHVLLAAGLLFAYGGVGVGRRGSPWLPHDIAAALGDTASAALWHAYNYGGIVLALICLVSTAFSSPDREARRKIRVMVWGALAGMAPVVLVNLLADLGVWERSPGVMTAAYLMVFLFPLSFAYAVVKHRVLELPVLLKRSARYLLVKRGFEVLLVVVGAQASALFAVSLSRLFRVESFLATTAGVGFGFLLAGVAAPAIRRTTRLIDRSFFRDAYDVRLILQELAESIRTVTWRDELASLLRRQLDQALHPSTIFVYLESPEGGRLHSDDAAVPPELRELAPESASLPELARRGRPRQVGADPDDAVGALLAPLGPECLVPIVGREARLLGLVVLGPRLSEEPYSRDDERLLASVASQAGIMLENMALAARIAERLQAEQRAGHEMELARQVQARLLPGSGPRLSSLEYAGRCVQARAVGGDYYDFLDAGAGRVGLVLADVSGKGLSAALLVASLHASLRSQSSQAGDLALQLQTVNRLLYDATEANRYATLFVGRFDDADRRLRYVNCGHNPPVLLRRDGSAERLEATAMVVGLVADWSATTAEVVLCPGDVLAIYSDGLTEATDERGEEFGEARFVHAIAAGRDLDPGALLEVVFEEVRRFSAGEQADDQTLVLARAR